MIQKSERNEILSLFCPIKFLLLPLLEKAGIFGLIESGIG